MKTNQIHSQEELQKIIYTFAEIYKYPEIDFFEEMASQQVDDELTSFFSRVNLNIKTNLKANLSSLEELHAQFMDCFSGIKQPFAPPVESVYKVWTTDPSAQVSIAKSKGYLLGDAALHMQHLFNQFQIEVPSGFENMPDHLTIQLEFLAYLNEVNKHELMKQFINDHLDWLDDFITELEKLESAQFYLYATKLLQTFLEIIK
jgi:putative dimethyl sulfoxide reductase chaperone